MKTLSFSNFSTNVHTHVNFSLWTLIRLFKQNIKFSFPFTHPFIMVRSISMLMMMMKLCKKEITSIRSPKLYVWVKCRVYWKRRWFNDKSTYTFTCVVIFLLLFLLVFAFHCWLWWVNWLVVKNRLWKWNRICICIRFEWMKEMKSKLKLKWPSEVLAKQYRKWIAYSDMRKDKHNNGNKKKIVNEQNKFPYHWSSLRASVCVSAIDQIHIVSNNTDLIRNGEVWNKMEENMFQRK